MTETLIDPAGPPRDSERLDETALDTWFREHVAGYRGDLTLEQFRRGHSNLTYLVSDGVDEWVLRRPPFGAPQGSAHDMGREYRILRGLHRALDLAPEAVAACEDPAVIGAPFFVMRRVRGVILRERWPAGVAVDAALERGLSEAFIETMARVHATDLEVAGLADMGRPEGYVERQVEGWSRRYARARTDDIESIERVASWLDANRPADTPGVLIHNDLKYDNMVLDPGDLTRVIGVLDWEMATVADRWMDLGTSLAYWRQVDDTPALHALPLGLPASDERMTRAEVVEAYARCIGEPVPDWTFYYAFGLFKVAVVAQQIYARFAAGATDDPRFAMMIHAVRALGEQAESAIATRSKQ